MGLVIQFVLKLEGRQHLLKGLQWAQQWEQRLFFIRIVISTRTIKIREHLPYRLQCISALGFVRQVVSGAVEGRQSLFDFAVCREELGEGFCLPRLIIAHG